MRRSRDRTPLGALLVCLLAAALVASPGCFWRKKAPEPEPDAQTLYRKGLDLIKAERYDEAREILNKVKVLSEETDLELLAQIGVADSYFEEEEYEAARAQYEEIFKLHSGASVADYLQYRIGECFFWQIDTIDRDVTNAQKALESYNHLLETFPESEYLPLARLRIRKIHTFLAEHELFIGDFYLKKRALLAAIDRFQKALALYPESGIQDKLLFHLYKTYKSLKDEDHAEEYRRLLMDRFPNSEYVPEVRKIEKEGIQGRLDSGAEPVEQEVSAAGGEAPELPSPGLAGSYQGPDKGSWRRRLLLLESPHTGLETRPQEDQGDSAGLAARSLREKLIP